MTGIKIGSESPWIMIPTMIGVFLGGLPVALGFAFIYIYKVQYRTAKTLFTDDEINYIDTPIYLHIAIAEKAKKLMANGKEKKDMSEYNEFCELVMLLRPTGAFRRY